MWGDTASRDRGGEARVRDHPRARMHAGDRPHQPATRRAMICLRAASLCWCLHRQRITMPSHDFGRRENLMTITRRKVLIGGTASVAAPSIRARAQATEVVIGATYPMSGANAQIGVDAQHASNTAL